MTQEQILSSNLSKAAKARKLYNLGFTRHQVADLICNGNYGWAHNIYKNYFGLETISRSLPDVFNHKFGIEIEAYGVNMRVVESAIRAAGVTIEVEGYNHSTRRHWKIVTDGSLRGGQGFEVVSPVLKGEAGIAELTGPEALVKYLNDTSKQPSADLHSYMLDYAKRSVVFRNVDIRATDYDSFVADLIKNGDVQIIK